MVAQLISERWPQVAPRLSLCHPFGEIYVIHRLYDGLPTVLPFGCPPQVP